jgi:plastocyanin
MGFRTRPRLILALWAACGLLALAVPASLLAADSVPQPLATTAATATVPAEAPATTTPTTTTAPDQEPPVPVAMSAPVTRAATPAGKQAASVSITDGSNPSDFGFNPMSVSVTAGETVTWTNTGSVPTGHTVTGSGFSSGVIHAGGTYSHTFSSPGTFSYHCSIHPFMKGTVTVAAAPSSNPNGGTSAGSGSNGSSTTPTTPTATTISPTGPTSESAATSAPNAAGSKSTQPMTGVNVLVLAALGGGLLAAGLRLRRA